MTDPVRIVVIAKACVPGRVKTRLTPPLTPEEAADLALVSLEQTLGTVRQVDGADLVLLLDGDPAGLDTRGFQVVPQIDGRLDERIAAVFDSSPTRVLLIGMDTPQVRGDTLQGVVDDTLSDAWFGPATDGGFWALGLRSARGDLVRGVPMSRDDTGEVQLARLRDAQLRVRTLPTLTDIDRFEDAVTAAAAVPGSAFALAVASLASTIDSGPESA